MERLGTTLQAMYLGGSVSGFIIAVIPEGRLESGWIEQSLVAKALSGGLESKGNHEDYLIPADRTVRLLRDRGFGQPFSVVMIGEPGLASRRFTVFQSAEESTGRSEQYLSAFWTEKQTLSHVMRMLFADSSSPRKEAQRDEPVVDYIEQLRTDASTGLVVEALSTKTPSSRTKPDEWLRESLARQADSESVPLKLGELKSLPALAKLFSTWISTLELARRTKPLMVSMMLSMGDATELVLWDGVRGLVTFAVVRSLSPSDLTMRFVSPMWAKTGESIARSAEGAFQHPEKVAKLEPERRAKAPAEEPIVSPVPETGTGQATAVQSELYRVLSDRLSSIGAEDLESRLAIVESEIRRLSFEQSYLAEMEASSNEKLAIDLMESRLKEVLERLESVGERMSRLEERAKRFLSKED